MTTTESRIARVVDLLARLASGDLTARGVRSDREDDIDAVIEGINMLAEELEAGRGELETRVQERTEALAAVNHDMLALAELGNLLAACETADEAYAMITHGLAGMFPNLSGVMYLYRASRNVLEPHASWGKAAWQDPLDPRHCWALRRGQRHLVDYDTPTLSCPHVVERTGSSICIPMAAHGETVGMLHLMGHRNGGPGLGRLTDAKAQLAVPVAEQISLALANIELREKLRVQAFRDPLTGLHNRRFADEWIAKEVSRTDRHGGCLGVVMVDVDHFKGVNDVHGHEAGDVMLQAIADTMAHLTRAEDVACRYGGEEFMVLMPAVDLATVRDRVGTLRAAVGELHVEYRGTALPPVTVSAGVALYPHHGSSAHDVIQAADAALYEAKRTGRDRVVLAH